MKPILYIILGCKGSGRRAIVADLLGSGLPNDETKEILSSENEFEDAETEAFSNVENLTHGSFGIEAEEFYLNQDSQAQHCFILLDGASNQVDQIEAIGSWQRANGYEIGRVITIVNCRLAQEKSPVVVWYESCIHFTDVVLLACRHEVSNRWIKDFQERFEKERYPCLFEFIKKDRAKNPALVLDLSPRRISKLFDAEEDLYLDMEPDEDEEIDEDEEVEINIDFMDLIDDPYLKKFASGRREKEVPDIRKYL